MSDFCEHEYELSGGGIELRTAAAADEDLIRRIVTLAADWASNDATAELPADLAHYFENWGRAGDIGVLAFQGIEFAGGACVRQHGPADGAYGYVEPDIPELSIGVESGFRRRGIGVLLLAALKAKVVAAGVPGISLSVAPDNPARLLYSRMGFELVERRATDVLMIWRAP